MRTNDYNCPCCGAPLNFDGASGKVVCDSCGSSFDSEALEAMNPAPEKDGIEFAVPDEGFSAEEAAQMQGYICKNCGAELITEDTATATECPYCGSPTILPDRIEGGVKPEKVIPFVVTKEQAQQQFEDYFKGKRLLPNVFLNGRNRISDMRKLYVPYWQAPWRIMPMWIAPIARAVRQSVWKTALPTPCATRSRAIPALLNAAATSIPRAARSRRC